MLFASQIILSCYYVQIRNAKKQHSYVQLKIALAKNNIKHASKLKSKTSFNKSNQKKLTLNI